jgi:hypothetical protein
MRRYLLDKRLKRVFRKFDDPGFHSLENSLQISLADIDNQWSKNKKSRVQWDTAVQSIKEVVEARKILTFEWKRSFYSRRVDIGWIDLGLDIGFIYTFDDEWRLLIHGALRPKYSRGAFSYLLMDTIERMEIKGEFPNSITANQNGLFDPSAITVGFVKLCEYNSGGLFLPGLLPKLEDERAFKIFDETGNYEESGPHKPWLSDDDRPIEDETENEVIKYLGRYPTADDNLRIIAVCKYIRGCVQ